ncbi:MAG: NADH-quinone oxidoreductase subunit NuoF [Anaerolineales bacterium]|nr:NADH-quinone oxidoreductase subunit NuoF [Anaerolineales bacterium]
MPAPEKPNPPAASDEPAPAPPPPDVPLAAAAAPAEPAAPAKYEHVLLRHRDIPNLHQLDVYCEHGGYETFKKVVTSMTPQQVIDEVKASGLRGRGGAGFPTGLKWSFLTKDSFPRYLVCNSDESEPGTFKDREILEHNPHQFYEGMMIAAYAAQANIAYNYLRGEFWDIAVRLDAILAELRQAGLLGQNLFGTRYALDIHNHLGAGAYICGEESALLESLEGKLGQPRLKPPFPADKGLYQKPTVVNNTETLTNVPMILARGAAWYKTIGTEKSPGPKIFCLSGHIRRPGNYELPLGTTFRHLIYELGGGVPSGKPIKAILTAGASSTVLASNDALLDTPMDYEALAAKGGALGSASIIVLDESVDMAWLTLKTTRFFKHESCGKCTPCREGTYWMLNILERLNQGNAVKADVDLLQTVALQEQGKCLCPLGEFAVTPVLSGLAKFRADFDGHTQDGKPAPAKAAPAARPAAARPARKTEPTPAGG